MCAPYVVAAARKGPRPKGHPRRPKARVRLPNAGFSQIEDLTHPLSPAIPPWPGEEAHRLEATPLAEVAKDGYYLRAVAHVEHLGTHLDAPAHFAEGGATVEAIPADRLVAPLFVISIAEKAAQDPDAELTAEDLAAFEARHGPIPEGAVVALYSGWERYITDAKRLYNPDAAGRLHFPGFSPEAARILVESRRVAGLGTDTPSLDPGRSETFSVHQIALPAGVYGVENLARLGRVPPAGSWIVIGAPSLVGGSGVPVRAFALWSR